MERNESHPTAEEPGSFGQELRREREVRNVTLEEISRATKVSVRFLTALENDDFAILPAPVFTKGFVKAYADYLGLDAEGMINSYTYHRQRERGEGSEARAAGRVEEKRSLDRMQRAFANRRRVAGAILAVLLVLAAVIAWLLLRPTLQRPTRTDGGGASTTQPSGPPPSPLPVEREEPPPESTMADRLTLELDFGDSSWVEVRADGEIVLEGVIAAGETRVLEAEEGFAVKLGNAGGVGLRLNGRALEPLGPRGSVREARLGWDDAAGAPAASTEGEPTQ